MGWRFLDRNPDGSVEQYSFDPDTGRAAVRLVSDVQPLLDLNAKTSDDGRSKGPLQLVARINAQVIAHWAEVHGVRFFDKNHTDAVLRLLDSAEYHKLRVGGGRLR